MKNQQTFRLPFILAVSLGAASSLHAQNTFYNDGDLVLFFQKPGSNNTVYVSLGNAATQYRGSAAGPTADRQALNIININSVLTTAFPTVGGDWKTDGSIFAGLAAARSTSSSTTLVIDGDPARTLYASQARQSVGVLGTASSEAWDFTTSGFSGPATGIYATNSKLETEYSTQAAVSPVSISTIDDQNPIQTGPGGIFLQPSAFGAFPGGIQQQGPAGTIGTFGTVGQVKFALDLYRILPRITAPNQITGPDKTGSYEGTIVVGIDGNVSFITQGTGNAYDTWIGTYNPPLTLAGDRLATADPDHDGLNNLAEFVLNGNPGTANPAIAPTLDASGSNFVFSFTRRDDSEAIAPVVFQYGGDLGNWTDVPVGASNSTSGTVTVDVNEGGTVTDSIMVTIPKSTVVGGKLFGRLKVVK